MPERNIPFNRAAVIERALVLTPPAPQSDNAGVFARARGVLSCDMTRDTCIVTMGIIITHPQSSSLICTADL